MKLNLRLPFAVLCFAPAVLRAEVVINEFQYDDTGADDREFVELYNSGTEAVDIGGWVVGGYDPTTTNPAATITAGTVINPGGFYVLGNAGVLNAGQSLTVNSLENDNEVITLRDGAGVLVDAVAYETNRGVGFVTTGTTAPTDKALVAAQVGPGIFGNSQGIDISGTPLNTTVSHGRIVDGRDTNNNGRDFALRPGTPGQPNNPGGALTAFTPADPDPLPPGAAMPGMTGSFVPPRVIDPTLVDSNNPNAISGPGAIGAKAYIVWDPSGGGNAAVSLGAFPTTAASFSIRAYLDTTDLPVQFNAASVQFRGSEITIYGLGSADALTNLTDLDGSIGLSAIALPAAESANGFTGVAWIYERVAADPASPGAAYSEKLHLVDAKDGGDSDKDGNTPLAWTILATYDLGAAPSGWYDLVISIDAAGRGLASFDGRVTSFTTGLHASAFNVGYRENLQIGADGTPDALLRPPTFTFAPVPAFVAGPLAFTPPAAGARNMALPALPGQSIGIFYSTDLSAGSWTDIGSVTVSGITGSFADTDPVRLANPRGLYRASIR